MIRINLLGLPRKGKRMAAPAGGGGGMGPLVIVLVVGVLAVGGNGGYYVYLKRQAGSIAERMQKAQQENKLLQNVKEAYEKKLREKDSAEKRGKAIEQLEAKKSGPVDLLNTVANTVSSTDAVWLVSMKEEGNSINIEGTALSASAVANLIANLRNTKYFKSVEIKETYQDDTVRDMQAFQFSLTCEKQPQKS